jgi:hypothetical protein
MYFRKNPTKHRIIQMRFRQSSAVRTLNGKSGALDRKCLFSVTSASAPAHSVYPAIKASTGLSPLDSYLKAISKGTTISSSIVVKALTKLLNSWKASGDKFSLTSSNIVREIWNDEAQSSPSRLPL